jgi:hypothetical protein
MAREHPAAPNQEIAPMNRAMNREVTPGEVTREASGTSHPPSTANQTDDRRFVLGSFAALIAIAVFFIAIGRYEGTTPTTTGQSSAPAKEVPRGGSSSLPKGPGGN